MSLRVEGDMVNQINSKKMKVGKLDIHYLSGGDGDPLVLIHGGLGGAMGWLQNMTELSSKYTIYAPDLPGFGSSQSISDDFQVSELVDFIDDINVYLIFFQ